MSLFNHGFWLLLLLFNLASNLYGQTPEELKRYRYESQDSSTNAVKRVKTKLLSNLRPTEKFDIIFDWGFLLSELHPNPAPNDSAPVRSAGSGSRSFGISFNYTIGNRLIAKIQPSINLMRITLDQTERKNFIVRQRDSLTTERIRAEYVELPICISLPLKVDSSRFKVISFIDVGFGVGYRLGSSYKYISNRPENRFRLVVPTIEDLNPWRTYVCVKLAYRFVGIWATYRLSPVFRSARRFNYSDTETPDLRPYPKFPPFELGFSIIL
jgi:hypothetical protein